MAALQKKSRVILKLRFFLIHNKIIILDIMAVWMIYFLSPIQYHVQKFAFLTGDVPSDFGMFLQVYLGPSLLWSLE